MTEKNPTSTVRHFHRMPRLMRYVETEWIDHIFAHDARIGKIPADEALNSINSAPFCREPGLLQCQR